MSEILDEIEQRAHSRLAQSRVDWLHSRISGEEYQNAQHRFRAEMADLARHRLDAENHEAHQVIESNLRSMALPIDRDVPMAMTSAALGSYADMVNDNMSALAARMRGEREDLAANLLVKNMKNKPLTRNESVAVCENGHERSLQSYERKFYLARCEAPGCNKFLKAGAALEPPTEGSPRLAQSKQAVNP